MTSFMGKISAPIKLAKIINKSASNKVVLHSSFSGFIGRLSGLICSKDINYFYIPHCISFMRKDIGKFKHQLFIALEKIASLKECVYIACSESEKKIIEQNLPKVDCRLVENAVSNDFTGKVNLESLGDMALQVITVGQIRTQKNPELFAEICRLITSINQNINFTWIGDGNDLQKNILMKHGVKVTGWLSRDEVIASLKVSDIYLSTSDWEGLPVSIIEANYAGIPVIASNCPGNSDVIKNGITGWLFENSEEAVELLLNIKNTDIDIRRIARTAQVEAIDRFSKSQYVSAMNKIMSNISS
ncbi:glycosyltransferase [Cobetia amphilecti]|uniref:Glycosyltransferase n=1 Tax=Cobetia amphilecti TaxID=1055104 RepID=A0ABT6UTZ3_9GAMM|nr:glycosyltransferase [Cobetia amphilecti]MDI5886126.1 glycosyltransferase [Cobetia amphilecti]